MSTTLINALKWYKHKNNDEAKEQLIQKLTDTYEDNKFTVLGHSFEDEVFAGYHKTLNPYIENTDKQVWFNKTLDFGAFDIRLSGRFDAITKDRKHIYDIKRTQFHYEGKYDRKRTIQHDLYMFLCDEAKDFTYLIAANGQFDGSIIYIIETYKREDDLETVVRQEIIDFLEFLQQEDLLGYYMENYEFMRYKK